jgi:hypothetical protein
LLLGNGLRTQRCKAIGTNKEEDTKGPSNVNLVFNARVLLYYASYQLEFSWTTEAQHVPNFLRMCFTCPGEIRATKKGVKSFVIISYYFIIIVYYNYHILQLFIICYSKTTIEQCRKRRSGENSCCLPTKVLNPVKKCIISHNPLFCCRIQVALYRESNNYPTDTHFLKSVYSRPRFMDRTTRSQPVAGNTTLTQAADQLKPKQHFIIQKLITSSKHLTYIPIHQNADTTVPSKEHSHL